MPPPDPTDADARPGHGTGEDGRASACSALPSLPTMPVVGMDVGTMAADLTGALVVRVVANDAGQTRDLIFRSSTGSEAAVRRAEARGREALVLLCQLLPMGVATL